MAGVFLQTLRALSADWLQMLHKESSSLRLLDSSVLILAISFVNVNSKSEFRIIGMLLGI